MNQDLQQVVNTCIMLHQAGKKPSVGMIKAKLAVPLPIPVIIRGLSYWKENKDSATITNIAQSKIIKPVDESDLVQRVSLLEREIQTLRNEVRMLKQGLEGAN